MHEETAKSFVDDCIQETVVELAEEQARFNIEKLEIDNCKLAYENEIK